MSLEETPKKESIRDRKKKEPITLDLKNFFYFCDKGKAGLQKIGDYCVYTTCKHLKMKPRKKIDKESGGGE